MRLADYLVKRGLTQKQFGKIVGVDQSQIARYVGGRVPHRDVMQRIIEKTDGAVTANDFFEVPEVPTLARAS